MRRAEISRGWNHQYREKKSWRLPPTAPLSADIYIYIYMHEDCLIISNVNSASFWYLTDSSHQCQWKCTSFQSEAARRAGCRRIEMEEGKKLICFFSPTAAGGDSARVCLPTQKLTNYNWASTVTGKKWIFCWWENIRQVLVIVL